ncbi:C40 family peptidase [Acidithiobacillus ferrooxidans]|jgi:cell wall-associated NlpC family hydrolase|uniref:C40 family peptidase n=1 Tax=Acidithiobacillus ferrooxidans TaxID=920 RepID=UPI0013D89596|nr:C40 family peptidase [Acidithiobacillus ferrooxidans]MBU2858773.1 C40 family peptidase [Acidithiobacillus ferrooxidans]MBU2859716.1 C40 family peptidase [Acidithiobacillus ferrooxidans]MCR2830287.1 C40 family peptidase [Acidithiobacillus ferrooxidans]
MQKKHHWQVAMTVMTLLGGIGVCQAAPHGVVHKPLHRVSHHSIHKPLHRVSHHYIHTPLHRVAHHVYTRSHHKATHALKSDYTSLTPTALQLLHLAPVEFAGVGAAPQAVPTYGFPMQSFPEVDRDNVTSPVFIDQSLGLVKAGMVTDEAPVVLPKRPVAAPVDPVPGTPLPEQSHLRLALEMLASQAYHWTRHPLQALESSGNIAVGTQAATQLADDIAQEGEYADSDGHSATGSWLSPRQMVVSALKFIGAPYRWGGMSPVSGFDCSGFVKYILAKFDIHVPRTSYAQAAQLRRVSRDDLKPGDLVFFDTLHRPFSHVGIYIGDQHFVSAQTPSTGVRVASLNDPYWAARFDGARRLPVSSAS